MIIIRINRGRRVNLGRVRGGGPQAFGYLMSATGVGALGGAVFLASRRNILGLGKVVVVAGIMYGLGLFALSLAHYLFLFLVIALGGWKPRTAPALRKETF